jgi:hypothetical protein
MLGPDNQKISYHQQEFTDYCGGACAQMLIHSLDFTARFKKQAALMRDISSKVKCPETEIDWASAPDALTNLINANAGSPPIARFHLVRAADEPAITRRIIWNIEHFERAAIALVHGFQHWVVVRGYSASKQPTGPDDTTYDIVSLFVYDPGPSMPVNKPGTPGWPNRQSRHMVGDTCPSEFPHGNSVNQIAYADWKSKRANGNNSTGYMTGMPPSIRSSWKSKFLAICVALDGEDPADLGCRRVTALEGDQKPPAALYGAGDTLKVENTDVNLNSEADTFNPRQKAQQGLEDQELIKIEEWKAAITGATPGQPRVVQHLDDPNVSYLIVPFSNADAIPLVVSLNATTGEYLQAAASRDPKVDVHPIKDSKTIKENLVSGQARIGDRTIVLRPEELPEGDLPMVWKPCLESFTPFVPFYRVSFQPGPGLRPLTSPLYARASDGALFTGLTSHRGGV